MFLRSYSRLPATDVPKLVKFYQSLIPLPFAIHKSKQYADVDIPGGVLALFGPKLIPRGHETTPLDRNPTTFHLDVEDVDGTFQTALLVGAKPFCKPHAQDGLRHACVQDLDGNTIVLEGPEG